MLPAPIDSRVGPINAARMVVGRGSERAEGEPPNLREPGHLARGYVMHCGCDRKLLGVNELLEDRTAVGQARRRQAGVRLGDLLNQRVVMGIPVAIAVVQRRERGLEVLEQRRDIAELDIVDSALDRAAKIMSQDDDRLGTGDLG